MSWKPLVPVWCWVVEGADQLYFSQPTMAWMEAEMQSLANRRACVARCQHPIQVFLDEPPWALDTVPALAPPIQCGVVASLDAVGRYVCASHRACRVDDDLMGGDTDG